MHDGQELDLHPLDERYVEAYAVGSGIAPNGLPASPCCPLCLGELVPTPHQRRGHRYFMHRREADAARCPLSTASYQPPEFAIGATRPDPLVAADQRAQFFRNWKRHFQIARHHAPALTIERFTCLIDYADVMNLWSCAALDQRDLPYVLLVLAGFIATHRKGETTVWLRFWFDGRVRTGADLWRPGGPRAGFFRLQYRDPVHTPFPTGADIVRWERIEHIDRIVDLPASGVGPAETRAFDRFLARDPGGRRA
ncbi:hypothetical protein [Burkholderia alba]|uniref:hypothetical protein n=1 Tax=Burkholderia alba TaxID=2683677 RepID=UPI002B05F4BC|nr:hypothetical protein [Burkholderia alba]